MDDIPAEHPEPFDMAAERKIVKGNIDRAFSAYMAGGVPPEMMEIANGLIRLWYVVEQEIRRIDNELTEAVAKRD